MEDIFEASVTKGSIDLCVPCRALSITGTVMSVISVGLDIWLAASIVSWAGKQFGWWSKDYVNDLLQF
ncbi:MAG: hypothetical protein NKF70_12880 [Methanobacterium sp. ERen5]|nr:MAG: hypothetical protein NKF70_12880 [Methanobacterium sp. ERen5]